MKKLFAFAVVLMLVLTSVCALADWPERSIELIVPANPGGDTDANARALAAALNEELGWNVIVTNMSGGSGAVAFEDLLSNPDDGYHFVFYHSGACITQMLGMYEEFNVLDDFKLAGMPFLDYSNAFVMNTSNSKFNDLASMVAYMKEHPGEVTSQQKPVPSSICTVLLSSRPLAFSSLSWMPVPLHRRQRNSSETVLISSAHRLVSSRITIRPASSSTWASWPMNVSKALRKSRR